MGFFEFSKAYMKNIEEIIKSLEKMQENIQEATQTINIEWQKPKPVRHKKSFWIDSITNLAHSYLKNLCVSSKVEPISKSEIKESLQSLRLGGFNIEDYINLNVHSRHASSSIAQTIEEEFIKKAEAKLQDIQAQIKLKENALKEASLHYDLQMAKIQVILNKIKE